jgi:acyl-CoA synthetase (AMP-forming)/AMP-acid ligase II
MSIDSSSDSVGSLPIFQCVGLQKVEPEKLAYIFVNYDGTEERVTCGDIFANTNRMSRALLEAGVGKGDTFVLLMRNHPEFLYGLFAALSIGAVAVPVDPRSKGHKLAFQIRNTKARGIFLSGEFLGNLREVEKDIPGVPVLGVTYKGHHGVAVSESYPSLDEILTTANPDLPDGMQPLDLSAPAQVIHTSGTTGDPKGVVLKADRYMGYGMMGSFIWGYREDDVLYTGLSMTHGNAQSVTVIPALARGIPAVLSERFTKSRIWDICRSYKCTSFSLLGGMMSGIYNEPGREDDADNPVRVVISAGTPRAIWQEFLDRFDVEIHEWYAAVEGGMAHNPPGSGPVGSFGKPPEEMVEIRIVDEDDNEVPPGERGELISRMKSGPTEVNYFGKEKESRNKTRGGWLRSGDICHRDENGFLYFDFRKGGGLRRQGDFIQPDYVEKVLGDHPDVSEVCVYGIPAASGAPGESDLVAAVVLFGEKDPDLEAIRGLCMEGLEGNSIPTFLQVVGEIPKTVSEKALDRVLREAFSPDAPGVFRLA